MNSPHGDRALPRPGCPIRRSPDQHLLSGSPELIAASHVLRRLLAPRHSPCALSSLTMLATGRPPERVFGRNAWVSYHALALELTVTRPDCQRTLRGSASSPAPDRHCDPRSGSAGTAAGITRRRAYGADGDRTHDLRLAKPALSRLSYSPEIWDVAEAASPNGPEGRPERPREAPRAYPLTFDFDPAPVPLLSSGCCPPLVWVSPIAFGGPGIKRATCPHRRWAQVESN